MNRVTGKSYRCQPCRCQPIGLCDSRTARLIKAISLVVELWKSSRQRSFPVPFPRSERNLRILGRIAVFSRRQIKFPSIFPCSEGMRASWKQAIGNR